MPAGFRFPNPVNEVAARTVAAGVVVLATAAAIRPTLWLLVPLAYGFLARVAAGPTFSPWAQLVTGVIVPRLPFKARLVPGPPKRFAQGIGAVLSSAAVVSLLLGAPVLSTVLVGAIAVAATAEAAFGFCLGCRIFAGLQRVGVIPESVCEACAAIPRTA